MATREASDRHQKWTPLDRDRTVHSPDISSDSSEVSWKNSTIAVRSNHDRGSIEQRSGSFIGRIASRQSDADRRTTKKTRGPLQSAGFPSNGGGTSWKNSTIAARSSRNRGDSGAESLGIHLQSIGR